MGAIGELTWPLEQYNTVFVQLNSNLDEYLKSEDVLRKSTKSFFKECADIAREQIFSNQLNNVELLATLVEKQLRFLAEAEHKDERFNGVTGPYLKLKKVLDSQICLLSEFSRK